MLSFEQAEVLATGNDHANTSAIDEDHACVESIRN